MQLMRVSRHVLAISAVALVACADHPTTPTSPRDDRDRGISRPGALARASSSTDPTAIPIGSPTRIEFRQAGSLRRAQEASSSRVAIDTGQLTASLAAWLSDQHPAGGHDDPGKRATSLRSVLAATTLSDLHTAVRFLSSDVGEERTARRVGNGLTEHVARYKHRGREVLRVTTSVGPRGVEPAFLCTIDPASIELDPACPSDVPVDDPSFDPAAVAGQVAAMQADIDAMSSELTALGGLLHLVEPGVCDVERAAFVAASLAFLWGSGEAVYFAWRRDIPNTYRALKIASIAYGAAYTAYVTYRNCLRSTRPRY